DNPKRIRIRELEAATLPRVLNQVDLALINTNYALEAGLNPAEDALIIEGAESPYVNILVAREDNKDSPALQKLVKGLQSDAVKPSSKRSTRAPWCRRSEPSLPSRRSPPCAGFVFWWPLPAGAASAAIRGIRSHATAAGRRRPPYGTLPPNLNRRVVNASRWPPTRRHGGQR